MTEIISLLIVIGFLTGVYFYFFRYYTEWQLTIKEGIESFRRARRLRRVRKTHTRKVRAISKRQRKLISNRARRLKRIRNTQKRKEKKAQKEKKALIKKRAKRLNKIRRQKRKQTKGAVFTFGLYLVIIAFYIYSYVKWGGIITFYNAIIFVCLMALLGLSGRIFCHIPQNHVGGVFRGVIGDGLRMGYVVSNDKDYRELTTRVDPENPDGVIDENPNLEDGKSLVYVAWDIPVISRLTNLKVYSLNPFDRILKVKIFKNKWRTKAEINELLKDRTDKTVKVTDRVLLADEVSYEKYLRIKLVIVNTDEDIELRGNYKVNYDRQSNVKVSTLDEIYLTQHRDFTMYANESIRAAHMAVFNSWEYKGDDQNPGFQDADLSEDPENDFNEAVRVKMKGGFGIVLLNTAINDWELSPESKLIEDAVNEATASAHKLLTAINNAKGLAAEEKERRLAAAAGDIAKLQAYAAQAGSKAGRIALMALRDMQVSENLTAGDATRAFGSDFMLTLDMTRNERKPKQNSAPAGPTT
jgi:hypothetical protein